MDLVSYLEWLYRQDLVKIHHGQLPFLGSNTQALKNKSSREWIHQMAIDLTDRNDLVLTKAIEPCTCGWGL